MEITTTLNRLRVHETCAPVLEKPLYQLGKTRADDEPLPFSTILDRNGLVNTLLCCQAEARHDKLWWHFAVVCIESVRHLKGSRSLDVLPIEWRWVTAEERLVARECFLFSDPAKHVGQRGPSVSDRARPAIQAPKLTTLLADLSDDGPVRSAHARAARRQRSTHGKCPATNMEVPQVLLPRR